MAEDRKKSSLSWAREVPESDRPHREVLRLSDGYLTSVYIHEPSGHTSGKPVVYLHGIQSHPGWFGGSAARLAQGGHAVYQVTRRGSGCNDLERGHAASAQQLIDDVWAACLMARQHADCQQVHLLGVSWGGKLASCFALDPRRSARLASVTMVAPGIVPKVDLPLAEKLRVASSLILKSGRRFDIPLNDVALFTGNEVLRLYLRQDRHRLKTATARLLYASYCLDRMLRKAPMGCLKLPTTLILATQDEIINNVATKDMVTALAGGPLVVRRLVGSHTLDFEADTREFHKTLVEAIQAGE